MRYRFTESSILSGNPCIDFKTPFDTEDVKSVCIEMKKPVVYKKYITDSIRRRYMNSINYLPYPKPYHYWAFYKFLYNRRVQENIDNRRMYRPPPHYIAYQRHFGSNLGEKLLKYNCPKITPLWVANTLWTKQVKKYYRPVLDRVIPTLDKRLPFLVEDIDGIFDNYITIEVINNVEADCKTIFNVRDFL